MRSNHGAVKRKPARTGIECPSGNYTPQRPARSGREEGGDGGAKTVLRFHRNTESLAGSAGVVSCGIIGKRQSRESALSDSYFIAFLISQP
ncbi:hypothetical protein PBY51_017174 [Eleginops maclovinus]|uniref:Uncharacterized protein n=1 Tax=Eleginops maclovinus TaxID=56733 RepID=A0AAN8AIY8_ELEMC|nr:hypothetical protein PBY51_017174 [Eleginops maclovinus]